MGQEDGDRGEWTPNFSRLPFDWELDTTRSFSVLLNKELKGVSSSHGQNSVG